MEKGQYMNYVLPKLTDVCPAVYVSCRRGIMTTGSYVTPTDDCNLFEQLADEICKFEGEDEVMIVRQTTEWTVHVRGLHAPIGRINVLAMLDPTYRP